MLEKLALIGHRESVSLLVVWESGNLGHSHSTPHECLVILWSFPHM